MANGTGITQSIDRRRLLREALDLAVDGDTITNTEMMTIWGVTKGTWTGVRNGISGFPTPINSGNQQLYPRVASLKRMWEYETRKDALEGEKARRLAALLGQDELEGMPSLSDLSKASTLQQEVERRRLAQGELVLRVSQQRVAGDVFSYLSSRLSNLGTVLDPNGIWPPAVREAADKAGDEWLLRTYGAMKDMLAPDVAPEPPINPGDRDAAGRAGAPAASGKRGSRVAKPAGRAATA